MLYRSTNLKSALLLITFVIFCLGCGSIRYKAFVAGDLSPCRTRSGLCSTEGFIIDFIVEVREPSGKPVDDSLFVVGLMVQPTLDTRDRMLQALATFQAVRLQAHTETGYEVIDSEHCLRDSLLDGTYIPYRHLSYGVSYIPKEPKALEMSLIYTHQPVDSLTGQVDTALIQLSRWEGRVVLGY